MNKRLYTQVDLEKINVSLNHKNPVLSIGSCFSEEVVTRLKHGGFNCQINPYGILFDPLSCARVLKDLIEGKRYIEGDLTYAGANYVSLNHHGSFNDYDQHALLKKINENVAKAEGFLKNETVIILTWGTAFVWERNGSVVGNCHRLPQESFIKRLIQPKEIISTYSDIIRKLEKSFPELKIILTVSPVRYLKEGLVNNSLSKAHLIKAAHELQKQFNNVTYFPSFEMFNDELRDYRFYEADLIHPNQTGIDYVFDAFLNSCMENSPLEVTQSVLKLSRVFRHRSHSDNDQALINARKTALESITKILSDKYPSLDLEYVQENFIA